MDKKKVIELANVAVFQRENQILSGIDLEVEQGEFVYIIGKVGTGKTSLIKTLNAELPLLEGSGRVLDFELKKIKAQKVAELRRKLGVVFQDFRLLTDRTVFENLSFVLHATGWRVKNVIKNRVEEVLDVVGMKDKVKKMPHELSGGEQQRVVIARAILNKPEIILADEPTGNLDPETSEQILDLFIRLNDEGKTIMMATHDYAAIAKKPGRTMVCANGQITDSANNTEHLAFDQLLEKNF